MAIVDGPGGTQGDVNAVVWDLAIGFAALAKSADPNSDDARTLHAVAFRLRKHADRLGKADVSAHLDPACHYLALRI